MMPVYHVAEGLSKGAQIPQEPEVIVNSDPKKKKAEHRTQHSSYC
jgi:hypothetical protein